MKANFFYQWKKVRLIVRPILVGFIGLLFFLSSAPLTSVLFLSEHWHDRHIVDVMWQSLHDKSVIDSFMPSTAEAAQATLEIDTTDATNEFGPSPAVVFTSDQNGYVFFIDSGYDLAYRKTTNGGTNWSAAQVIDNVITGWITVSVWYDQWTPGDTSGTRIHIAAADTASDDVYYTYLDTSTDTLKGSMVMAVSGSATLTAAADGPPSITRGASGYLFISANFTSTAGGKVSKSTATDGSGDSWSDITPTSWSSVAIDQIQLLPLLTGNDVIAIKAETASNAIKYRIYGETGDSWAGSWSDLSVSPATMVENTTYDQWFSATIKKSTGDVYLTFANYTNNDANDIEFWSFDESDRGSGFVKKTNLFTDERYVISPVPLVDEESGDVYVVYLQNLQPYEYAYVPGLANAMYLYYKKSTDGGTTWSDANGIINDDYGDDYRYLRGNLLSSDRLYIIFHDDDDNDIFGTTIMSQQVPVEANIDTAITDATDEFGPSPSGVFADEDIGYNFFVKTNLIVDATMEFGASPSVVFTDADTGYVFFIGADHRDLLYRKTTNGGLNWSPSQVIDTTIAYWVNVAVWYDQWTPGDTSGTKIHIAASDYGTDDVYYTYLDTASDTLKGSVVTAVPGSTTLTVAADGPPSITKGGGDALFISANFTSTVGGKVYKSTDGAGDSWTNTNPTSWSSVAIDQIQLLPLLTGDDIIAIRADTANDDIDYQIYDETTTDQWSGSWTSISSLTENTTYDNWFSATIKKSTGDVYLTFANYTNNTANDIEFWSFDESDRGSGFTPGANVYDNSNTVLSPVPIVEEDTGDIYVAYARGTLANTMRVYYKSSSDGGTSWSDESSTVSPTLGDDFKTLKGNLLHNDTIYVVWYNDDLNTIGGNNLMSPAAYDHPVTGQNVVYRKTTDGGSSWGTPMVVSQTFNGATSLAVWYDQWTPGDTTGTKIHIAFSDDATDDIYYTYLDTDDDSSTTSQAVLLGTSIREAYSGPPSITKGAGDGNLFLSGNFQTTAGGQVAKSTNGGISWSDITPSAWSTVEIDQIQLLPLLTGNDIIAVKAETASNAIKYRIYSEGGTSWDGSWNALSVSPPTMVENATYDQWFSATIKKSTGDVYLAFADYTNNVANDIGFWSFDESVRTGFAQGSNLFIGDNTVMMPVPFINEENGDIYVAYLRGTLNNYMNVYYKKSMDGGTTWSGESDAISPGLFDDIKALRSGFSGLHRMYLFWHNDDLNDIYGNTIADRWRVGQAAYRWFQNADSTDVGTALASQDTPATLAATGDAFRLRLLLSTIGRIPVDGENFKLQFAEKSGTCDVSFSGETYADVTGATVIAFNDNTTPSDGDNLTANANDPVHSGYTVVNQTYEESSNFTATSSIPSGQDGKWDFSLIDNSASAGTSYCFRVVESDGTLLHSYDVIPEIITAAAGGSLDVGIVDDVGSPVANPNVHLDTASLGFTCQTTSGTFGSSTEKIRVANDTAGAAWTLTIATSTNAYWLGGSAQFDFNDAGSTGCADSGDGDSLAGQLTLDPSGAVVTPEGGCSSTGISKGSLAAFAEGSVDTITLITADGTADTGCYWDVTDIGISQSLPAEQLSDEYALELVLTLTAS